MKLENPNRNNSLNINPVLAEYWIEDSALYYEQYNKLGYVYYKYTIENDQLVKFSRLNFKVLPVILILLVLGLIKPFIQVCIMQPNFKNICTVAALFVIIFLVLTRNIFVKRKMKKIWDEKKNLITVK